MSKHSNRHMHAHTRVFQFIIEVIKKPVAMKTSASKETRRLRKNVGSEAYHATFTECIKSMDINAAKLEACRQSDIAKKVFDDSLVSDMAAESA